MEAVKPDLQQSIKFIIEIARTCTITSETSLQYEEHTKLSLSLQPTFDETLKMIAKETNLGYENGQIMQETRRIGSLPDNLICSINRSHDGVNKIMSRFEIPTVIDLADLSCKLSFVLS